MQLYELYNLFKIKFSQGVLWVQPGVLWVQQGVLWVQQGVLWVQQLLWMLVWTIMKAVCENCTLQGWEPMPVKIEMSVYYRIDTHRDHHYWCQCPHKITVACTCVATENWKRKQPPPK
ncbi:hypothetical protein CRUP_010852 [Coryphaenoides rupestris]|nr:hypothetical protein CRUP_010852 [Coryphaenoides rupestris]